MDIKEDTKEIKKNIKVREYKAPLARHVFHISLGKSDRIWVSNGHGKLVPTDLNGNRLPKKETLPKIKTSRGLGFHTVTKDGDLIYTSKDYNVINMVTLDNKMTLFIETGDFKPLGIYSSLINGDFLVGMMTDKKAIVRRYDKAGKKLQSIESSSKRQLYSYPHYITENINGDICTSDYNKGAVVVVKKSGQYRFSYTGHDQGSVFHPFGICTDILGHIIVCSSDKVDILDADGQWLSALATPKEKEISPRSVCVDNENDLHVRQSSTNDIPDGDGQRLSALPRPQEKGFSPRSAYVDDENDLHVRQSSTNDIPDGDGQQLSSSPTPKPQEKGFSPRSVCVDDENNLHVGQSSTNIVAVYKYLQ